MKNIPYGKQFIDKEDAKNLLNSLSNDLITTGPLVKKFEKKIKNFLKCKFSYVCSSGTSAIHLAFLSAELKKGDVVLWHALTLHQTTGQSDKKTRISVTTRFTSNESEFSSQERALGYKTLTVGPLNQIKRIIGNDQFYPLRTYNTFAGTDKRLSELYNQKINHEVEKIKFLILDK